MSVGPAQMRSVSRVGRCTKAVSQSRPSRTKAVSQLRQSRTKAVSQLCQSRTKAVSQSRTKAVSHGPAMGPAGTYRTCTRVDCLQSVLLRGLLLPQGLVPAPEVRMLDVDYMSISSPCTCTGLAVPYGESPGLFE